MAERIAIVGCGVMGGYHANTALHSHDGEVKLTHLVDVDIERAQVLSQRISAPEDVVVSSQLSEITGEDVDGAIIAASSKYHTQIAEQLMRQGVNVLVEKPIALNVEDALRIKQTAESLGMVAMVGHVELFNPVVRELDSLINGDDIKTLRFKRLGKVDDPARLLHDVVQDLMLHDLTIAHRIMENREGVLSPEVVMSHGREDTVCGPDPAEAVVNFGSGVDAHFRASRAYSGGKVRSIEVETTDGLFVANLLNRTIVRKSSSEGTIVADGTYTEEVRTSSYFANDLRQPLALEQMHFAKSIRGEATPAEEAVAVDNAIGIMHLTDEILEKMIISAK